ncbi:MAG: helix-turn-helix transcriptional regulator [Spirochaetales bacterium]|nr:helix-turn-helix transcriptional regulator [Spirochaetales bacterium]
MNYYRRIQKSIDFIEENLGAEISAEEAASQAFLSTAQYYRLFPEFTGYSFKEYVRKRRLCESLEKVAFSEESIYDIAFDSGFNTEESYARAFSREFGRNPSQVRKYAAATGELNMRGLEPVTLVTEFFDDLVIKFLEEQHVVTNAAVSATPERDAWTPLQRWARTQQYLKKPYRIFGRECPPPPKMKRTDENGNPYFTPVPGVAYGYEFLLTVGKNAQPSAGFAKSVIPAGRYAVMSAESSEYGLEWKGRSWAKMFKLIESADYRPKEYDDGPRMIEEHVQHFPPDEIIRLDYYVELE